MKTAAIILFLFAGVFVSFSLSKESAIRLKNARCAAKFAKELCFEIENFKHPLSVILEKISECEDFANFHNAKPSELPKILSELCLDGGVSGAYINDIMDSDIEGAIESAKALCHHTKNIESSAKISYDSRKNIRIVLPVAAALMLGILIV